MCYNIIVARIQINLKGVLEMTRKKRIAKGMFITSKILNCNLTIAKKVTKCLLNRGTIETFDLISDLLPTLNCCIDDGCGYAKIIVDNKNFSDLFWEKV